jgi:hypothetical protein
VTFSGNPPQTAEVQDEKSEEKAARLRQANVQVSLIADR